jgi:hypothetical protein
MRPPEAKEATVRIALASLIAAAALAPALAGAAEIPSPSAFLKLDIGADRVLADYRQIRAYFAELDRRSPRVQVENLGKTTLGEDLIMAVISSEENMAGLPRILEISRKLSDPRGLHATQLETLAREGRAVLLITCNIHSTEIGAAQMAMEWAHALATAEDDETRRRLSQVVLLLVPSLNPDGLNMEVDWYRKYLGTRYEGGRMPWLYHHYVGHDDNRDWFMLTQKETRALSRAVYHQWFPQVWLDEHQMGNVAPRIFMPPYTEPVDADIHPLVWREVNLIGANMALRLEQAGKTGVIYGYAFDAYWPGGTKNTAWFKNISGLLTELASCRLATPIYIDPTELRGGAKGLVDYEAQTNFPNPWPGGWWRLRDIMDYERIVSDAILETCADHREDILRDMAARAGASIAAGAPGEGFRIAGGARPASPGWKLGELLRDHNVEVMAADDDLWVPLAQPYGRFVTEMLTTQRYPEVKLVPGKDIVRPYDVAAWSLPLMMGVTVERAAMPGGLRAFNPAVAVQEPVANSFVTVRPGDPEGAKAVNAALRSGGRVGVVASNGEAPAALVLDARAAAAARRAVPAGVYGEPVETFPTEASALRAPRVGLYKPWTASMDEGWTRFVLENYGFAPRALDNATIRKGNLRASLDAIVLPAMPKEAIATGKMRRRDDDMSYFVELPPEYKGGLEAAGAKALVQFVEDGGTLVAMGGSCNYVLESFNVPVMNVLAKATPQEFGCPGSLLRARLGSSGRGLPLAWGLPEEVALFVDEPMAFQTVPPGAEMRRWVLASYPDDPRDVLLSGWISGEDKLTRKAAAVAMTYGRGKIVLLGFRPQFRAQTPATYPFLFNALYWSVLEAPKQ